MTILMALCITLLSNFPAESAQTVDSSITVCEGMTFAITCIATSTTDSNEVQNPEFALLSPDGAIVESFNYETDNSNYHVASTKINQNHKTVYLVGKASFTHDNQMRYGCFKGVWSGSVIDATTIVNVIPADDCSQLQEPTMSTTEPGMLSPTITGDVTTAKTDELTRMTSPATDVPSPRAKCIPGNAIARQENTKNSQTWFYLSVFAVVVAVGLVIIVIFLLLKIKHIEKSHDSINSDKRGEPDPELGENEDFLPHPQ